MVEDQANRNHQISKKQYLRLYGWVNLYSLLSLIVGTIVFVTAGILMVFVSAYFTDQIRSAIVDEVFQIPFYIAGMSAIAILIAMPILLLLHGIYTLPIIRLFEKKRPSNVMLYWMFFSYLPIIPLLIFSVFNPTGMEWEFVYGLICPFIVGYLTKKRVLKYMVE